MKLLPATYVKTVTASPTRRARTSMKYHEVRRIADHEDTGVDQSPAQAPPNGHEVVPATFVQMNAYPAIFV